MPFLVCVLVVGAWDVDGGWMPLPTRPQRYCDPRVICSVIKSAAHVYKHRAFQE